MEPVPRLFEDFAVGLRFRSFSDIVVTAERIKSFAAEFDPQPFHLDDAGPETFFGGLVASGWHTGAVAMRLIVDSDLGLSGQGAGVAIESMRWLRPVHPGDTLRVEGTVTETRPSRSRGDRGVVKFRALVYNKGAGVLHMLRRMMGDEAFFNGLRHFYAEQKFQKAGSDDLRRVGRVRRCKNNGIDLRVRNDGVESFDQFQAMLFGEAFEFGSAGPSRTAHKRQRRAVLHRLDQSPSPPPHTDDCSSQHSLPRSSDVVFKGAPAPGPTGCRP